MSTPKESGAPRVPEGHVGQVGFDDTLLDPRNMMPATPNQRPHPEQTSPLSLDRESSSIPKAHGTGGKWLYPSPQMFYNALKRKGKGQDVKEDDMNNIVQVHNIMNERTWRRVLEWEEFHVASCRNPRLVSFRGKPDELSPKAFFLSLFGMRPKPFDRHDWVVDRAGTPVRYIIDYYYDESRAQAGHDAIDVDVRPALDSWSNVMDRFRMFWSNQD